MLKMGTYGFLRFVLPFFPLTLTPRYAGCMIALAVIGIIYGALVALVQPDMKKLVAYSSVSHLGFCVLGIFALNSRPSQGSILQMVNHGLSTGALFLLRRHDLRAAPHAPARRLRRARAVDAGLRLVFIVVVLSSVGLPGLNGFVGEFLILPAASPVPVGTIIAATGVILAAIYLLWALQRLIFNPLDDPENRTSDRPLTARVKRRTSVNLPKLVRQRIITRRHSFGYGGR